MWLFQRRMLKFWTKIQSLSTIVNYIIYVDYHLELHIAITFYSVYDFLLKLHKYLICTSKNMILTYLVKKDNVGKKI